MYFMYEKRYRKKYLSWVSKYKFFPSGSSFVTVEPCVQLQIFTVDFFFFQRHICTGQTWRGGLHSSPRNSWEFWVALKTALLVKSSTKYTLTPVENSFWRKQKLTWLFSKKTLTARFQIWALMVTSFILFKQMACLIFPSKNAIASSTMTLPAMLLAAYHSGLLCLMVKHSLQYSAR